MKALVSGEIIAKSTLETIKKDSDKLFFGIDYVYGTWKFKNTILMDKNLFVRDVLGYMSIYILSS